ncbi:MAG TPA: hypothetical protein VGR47_11535 [Terracidiphilus sp.]|nr:hypothetical protein [Terracidiphilus sp.]
MLIYSYDNARNCISMTDGNNNKTGYVYDARERLQETDYSGSTKKTYSYLPMIESTAF